MKIAELEISIDGHHLWFRFGRDYGKIKPAIADARMGINHERNVFIWDGKTLPINPNDPRTRDIIQCPDCLTDIKIQNRIPRKL